MSSIYPRSPKPGWTIQQIDDLLVDSGYDDSQLADLFASYARANPLLICREDFQSLLDAHGAMNVIDDAGFEQLLAENMEWMFIEQEDNIGRYYIAE